LPRVFTDDSTFSQTITSFLHLSFGESSNERLFFIISTAQRLLLSFFFLFLLAVAERTFKER
jgi:hypothetical protein